MVVKRALASAGSTAESCALLLACATFLGCAGGDPRLPPAVDCSSNDAYDQRVLQDLEGAGPDWFGFGDSTPGGVSGAVQLPIPEGRCGSTTALVISVQGHTDWGAGFGEPAALIDASGYEGISFWARATGFGKSSGFLLTIHDRNTSMLGGVCMEPMADDVAGGDYTYNEAGMIVPLGGELPAPGDCGNGFQRPVTAEREWHLHTLPFASFLQTANPNRVATGIDRSALYQFAINVPKDSDLELWLDDLALYRPRSAAAAESAAAAAAAATVAADPANETDTP
ncbi:MAG: hypothetical protein RL033_6138 [Pseudomonadota bacterium]